MNEKREAEKQQSVKLKNVLAELRWCEKDGKCEVG
jgi:hypothetical protein